MATDQTPYDYGIQVAEGVAEYRKGIWADPDKTIMRFPVGDDDPKGREQAVTDQMVSQVEAMKQERQLWRLARHPTMKTRSGAIRPLLALASRVLGFQQTPEK